MTGIYRPANLSLTKPVVSANIKEGLFVGEIEAVDPGSSSYRVRFDRPGLGTHTVPDYNVVVRTLPIITYNTLFNIQAFKITWL